jgi:NADPH2:quinone reductase
MRSIVYSRTGSPDVLQLVERDVVDPGPGEVRVRVIVSGVNPTDWKSRSQGEPAFAEITPNQDGSGVIDAVGDGVGGLDVGDRVWLYLSAAGRPTGTAQEYTNVVAEHAVKLPIGTSFDVGASLGVPAITAHRALTVAEDGPRRLHPGAFDGQTVLVAGGAGAVGHAAIQLARWAGARVITTVSNDTKAELASRAGAHHVVNYRTEDAAQVIKAIAPDGVDLIVEVAITANAALDLEVASTRAAVAIYAGSGDDQVVLPLRANMSKNLRYQFVLLYSIGAQALHEAAEDITEALIAGALPVGESAGLPLHRFSLADTAAAHAAVEGGVTGKVLVDVAE